MKVLVDMMPAEIADHARLRYEAHVASCRRCPGPEIVLPRLDDLCPLGRALDEAWTRAEHAWARSMGWGWAL